MAASLLHTDHTVPSGKGENHHHHHHHQQQQHHQHTSTVSTTAETLPWPGLAWFIPSFHYGVNFCSKVKPWASDCDGKHGRLLQNKRVAWEFVTSDGFFWCRKGTWNSFWKAFGPLSKLCSILLQVAILEMRICGYLWHSFLKKSALQKCRNSEKGHMGHHWSYDWYKASRLKAVREEYVGMFWVVSIWLKLWRKGELGLRYQKLTKIWSGLSAIVCQFATFCLQLWVQASLAFEVPGSFFFLWGSVGCLALCTTHWKTLCQKRGMSTLEEWAQKVRIPSATCYVLLDTGGPWHVTENLAEDSSPLIQNNEHNDIIWR